MMKNFLLFLIFSASIISCTSREVFKTNSDKLFIIRDTTTPITTFGYEDEKKNIVIPMGKYYFGFTDTIEKIGFVAKAKNGFLAINNKGEELFKVFPYDNGPDYVHQGLFRILDDHDLIGFANMEGKIVLSPKFTYVHPFSDSLAIFCEGCRRGGYKQEIPSPEKLEESLKKSFYKYGYINMQGDTIIPPVFDHAYNFDNGRAKVKKNEREYYINKSGNEIPPQKKE